MNVENYLSSFFKGTKNPSLKAMKFFMNEFNSPEKKLKIVHIAGTNGKGSCTEMLTNILIKSGYKVGKLISPHLIKYNERISVNNINISDKEIEELINEISPKIDIYNNENEMPVTLFELETTMAILYFYKMKCDIIILETGLGGLFDCTNIVNPIVSIITSIGYDHMNILGDSLIQIAEQKAGIIKENSETIFAKSINKEVNDLIKKICEERNNKLHEVCIDNIKNYSFNNEFQDFDYKDYKNITINLKGEKQLLNTGCVIECVQILRNNNFNISDSALRTGLKTVIHKGRFEKINENPLMIFDGAHNEPAIENFINSVKMYYNSANKVYIISILKTKDYETVLKKLLKDEEAIFIFTSGNNGNFTSKDELFEIAKKHTRNNNLYAKELTEAITFAEKNFKDKVIFFVGSFYVYSDICKKIHKQY